MRQSGGWREKTRIVYPFELTEQRAQRLSKMKVWLRARNIPIVNERIQANTFFAATIAGEDGDRFVAESDWLVP